MNAAASVSAAFSLKPFTLSVAVVSQMTTAGTGSGRVTSSPIGIDCGVDCSESYQSGTTVTLTGVPAPNSLFSGWSGACSGVASCSVTLTADRSVTATFTAGTTYTLTVGMTGSGYVQSNPGGINCGADCSEPYASGTSVTLTASPLPGYNFEGWSGGGCSGTGPCTITLNANASVTANFGQKIVSKIGVFRPSTGEYLLDLNDNGLWDGCEVDGCFNPSSENSPQGSAIQKIDRPVVVGDWNRTGNPLIGSFDPNSGRWYLDNGNNRWDGCQVDTCIDSFGQPGDLPVIGDWDGTGAVKIGVFRPSMGEWFLDLNGNGLWDGCQVDRCLGPFGQEGDLPLVGKW